MKRQATYRGYRFPSEIIGHAIWLYYRITVYFAMSKTLLVERGVMVSYANVPRKSSGRSDDRWFLDEGAKEYLREA